MGKYLKKLIKGKEIFVLCHGVKRFWSIGLNSIDSGPCGGRISH